MGFHIRIIHERIYTTHLHASCWRHCHYRHCCNVEFVLFHNITCYTKYLLSCIRVNKVYLFNITCTLVATSMILGRLECISRKSKLINLYKEGGDSWVYIDTLTHVLPQGCHHSLNLKLLDRHRKPCRQYHRSIYQQEVVLELGVNFSSRLPGAFDVHRVVSLQVCCHAPWDYKPGTPSRNDSTRVARM